MGKKTDTVAWALLDIADPEVTVDPVLADYWIRKGRDVTRLSVEAPSPRQEVIWYDANEKPLDVGLLDDDVRMVTITGSTKKFGDFTTPLFA